MDVVSGMRLPRSGSGRRECRQQGQSCQTAVDTRDSVTFALVNVEQSVMHRPRIREIVKPNRKKRAENTLDRLTLLSRSGLKALLYSCAETVTQLKNGSIATVRWERKTRTSWREN